MRPAPPGTPAVGPVVADRYELVQALGRGGMADVYEARDRRLRRAVAVKVFRGAAAADRARFDAEARVLASLSHPGLVQVYDAGEQDGDAFVVLELIDGPTAAVRLAEDGAMGSDVVAELGASVADALAFVHEHGVVHRDVTPANILCATDGRPRLADFGVARLVDTTRITGPETAIGTAAYMAPEQVEGHDVTPAADVYGLGLVLLELLTARRGFEGAPREAAVARLVRAPDVTSGVPGPWRGLLAAMTARDPADRPSAREVAARLRALGGAPADAATRQLPVAQGPSSTGPTATVESTAVLPVDLIPDGGPGHPRGWRRLAPAIVAAVVLAAVVAAGASDGGRGTSPTTTQAPPVVTSAPPATVAPTTTTTDAPPETPAGGGKEDKGHRTKAGPHR